MNNYHIQATCDVLNDVILYEDHRTLLNIFEIQKNKWIVSIPNLIYFDQYDDVAVPRGLSIKDRLAMMPQSLSVANIRYHRDLQLCPTPLEHYKSPAPVSGDELYRAIVLACNANSANCARFVIEQAA